MLLLTVAVQVSRFCTAWRTNDSSRHTWCEQPMCLCGGQATVMRPAGKDKNGQDAPLLSRMGVYVFALSLIGSSLYFITVKVRESVGMRICALPL